jgi:hypothetical protein
MSQMLDLDFVEQQTLSFSRASGWTVLLCLLGLLIAFLVAQRYQSLNAEYDSVASTLSSDDLASAKKAALRKESAEKISPKEMNSIRETVMLLGTPWESLLTSLEDINMKHIALLLLEPNKKKQEVMLTGQAKNIETMLEYVEEVSKLPMLSKVYLQNHMIELDELNKPVSFTVAAEWK